MSKLDQKGQSFCPCGPICIRKLWDQSRISVTAKQKNIIASSNHMLTSTICSAMRGKKFMSLSFVNCHKRASQVINGEMYIGLKIRVKNNSICFLFLTGFKLRSQLQQQSFVIMYTASIFFFLNKILITLQLRKIERLTCTYCYLGKACSRFLYNNPIAASFLQCLLKILVDTIVGQRHSTNACTFTSLQNWWW